MPRLVLCGWNDGTPELAAALELQGLVPVAVGDRRPARLAQARERTGLPCYQHLREMARGVDYDAALIDCEADAVEMASAAAEQGADLVVTTRAAGAESLVAIEAAARRGGVALALVGPLTHAVDLEAARLLTMDEQRWAPALAHIELSDEGSCTALLRDAVAVATRLLPDTPTEALVSLPGDDIDGSLAAAVHLRYESRQLVTISVRGGGAPHTRLRIEGAAGRMELEATPEGRSATATLRSGGLKRLELPSVAPATLETARIVRVLSREVISDAAVAVRAAATLSAVERSIETGLAAEVRGGVRSQLRVLPGGATTRSPRTGRLELLAP